MTKLDDVRRTIEATVGNLTPSKAQQIAKGFMEPGAAKDQVSKVAADLLEWSQRTREKMREVVRREIQEQLAQMGAATTAELDALKKRVRQLEREAGISASGTKAQRGSKARAEAKPTKRQARKTTQKKPSTRAASKG